MSTSPATKKIKWGVIGSGGIARRRTIPEGIIPASNAELIAVYGTNPKTNHEVAREFGVKVSYSLDALLASDIDAVYIASPVHAHRDQMLACAKAGKHILCEKPLGMNVSEAEEMVAACKEAKVQFGVAFMMRFQAQHQAALQMIREGKLGQPVFGRAQLSCWYPPQPNAWRQKQSLSGGGALMDLATHCIDLLEMFFGPVAELSCFINNTVHKYETEDSAVVMLRFANGATATVDTFFCIQDASSKNILELYGSCGSILATNTIGQRGYGEMTAYLASAPDGIKISPPHRNVYLAEIESFSDAILQGTENPLDAQVGLHNQKLLAACYKSAKTGHVVKV